jgi:antitoxin component YwqK of YwqJK toxin-antitoxin module
MQKIHDLIGDRLTYYFKNGKIKAEGPFLSGRMEEKWEEKRPMDPL